MAAPAPERGTLTCTRAQPTMALRECGWKHGTGGCSTSPVPNQETPLTPQLHGSRFCNGQSTEGQQGSTGRGEETVNHSIETTYFHSISTDSHKRCNLLWDRWSHLHNFHQLSWLRNGHWGSLSAFWDPIWNSVGRSPKFMFGTVVGIAPTILA